MGLMINVEKTKVLSKKIEPKLETELDEIVPEMVGNLQYLGAWVNDTMKNFKHRRAKHGQYFGSQENFELQC